MRRVLIVFLFVILLITACAPEAAPTEEPSDAGDQPTSTSVPTDSSPETAPIGSVEEAAIRQLAANLGLQESDITVISSEETEFPDACLGVAMEGVMCAQVVTPGRIVVLEANGVQYEYHISEDGSRIQPATLAMVWRREGGIAGFCNSLMVFRSGEVYGNDCNAQVEGRMGTFADLLTSSERQQFSDWIAEFEVSSLDASDPQGVADRMVVTLDLLGTGNKPPQASEQQELLNFAQALYQELAQK